MLGRIDQNQKDDEHASAKKKNRSGQLQCLKEQRSSKNIKTTIKITVSSKTYVGFKSI